MKKWDKVTLKKCAEYNPVLDIDLKNEDFELVLGPNTAEGFAFVFL
jgi:hypothetical protein